MKRTRLQTEDEAFANMKTFLCSYHFHGLEWEFEIRARNMEEAASRLRAVRHSGKLDGELLARIPLSLWQRLWRAVFGCR